MNPPNQTWAPPAEFAEYRLVRLLGQGAMGQVYLAEDLLLGRPVAVKFVGPNEPTDAQRERFAIEARAIARLQHPNVVAIYRVGHVQGRPYLVSEFARGQTLDRINKPLPAEQVLSIGLGLARGLAAAHRGGVLHRDLKPANAILSDDGEAKLLDFGLAKLLDAPPSHSRNTRALQPPPSALAATIDMPDGPKRETPAKEEFTLTHGDAWVGSPLYMAPEAWRREPASAQTDFYSFGVMLFELATGQTPHQADSITDLADAVTHIDAPSLATRGVPSARLISIVDRCLRREPTERFSSADELRESLEQALVPTRTLAPSNRQPYLGLRSFTEEDKAFFFGRDADVRSIIDRMDADSFVLVSGDSGVGKSSVCAAGVLPWLEAQGLPHDRRPFASARLVPGQRPLMALAAALAPLLGRSEKEVATLLASEPTQLGRTLRAARPDGGTVLFVDQLEELTTLSDPAEAKQVAAILASLASAMPGVRLLATARGDFLGRLSSLPWLGDAIQRALVLLRPLGESQLRQAIVEPARAQGVRFETDALVESLVSSAGDGSGLALLQFTLAELWRARNVETGVIREAALTDLGGVRGALARHADRVLEPLLPEGRDAAKHLLLQLVTPEGTRARWNAELLTAGSALAKEALEVLVRGRLVVAHAALGVEHGDDGVELAHEALLSGWDTLRGWLGHDAERRAVRQRLERAAMNWERLGRAREALWSGRLLDEVASADLGLMPARETQFVEHSERLARRRRRVQWSVSIALPLLVLTVWGTARFQTARRIDQRAAALMGEAEIFIASARALNAEVEGLRKTAFEHFDHGREEQGELAWAKLLDQTVEVDRGYSRGAQVLEGAVLLGTERSDIRRALAAVLFERAMLADRDRRTVQRDELIERMVRYDDGTLVARWKSPALVSIDTQPSGATISIRGGRQLGVAPIESAPIEPGSQVLEVELPGRPRFAYPVLLHREQALSLKIEIPKSVPNGFVYIAAGQTLFGSADDEPVRRALASQPQHSVSTGGYFISRTEVTFGQWIAFLEAIGPAQAQHRAPSTPDRAVELIRRDDGAWQLTLAVPGARLTASQNEPLILTGRRQRTQVTWEKLPVVGVTWEDALAYFAWLERTGAVPGARPCTEYEWERAARGADGRSYPHGTRLAADDANFDETYGRTLKAYGPDEVGAHPVSTSPFGVADLSGNVWEATSSISKPNAITLRGGSWYQDQFSSRIDMRDFGELTQRTVRLGVRVCASLR